MKILIKYFSVFFILILINGCGGNKEEIRDSRYFPNAKITTITAEGTRLNKVNLWNHPTRRTKVIGTAVEGEKIYIIQETENHYRVGKPGTSIDGWLNKEFVTNVNPPERSLPENGNS